MEVVIDASVISMVLIILNMLLLGVLLFYKNSLDQYKKLLDENMELQEDIQDYLIDKSKLRETLRESLRDESESSEES